MAHCSHGAENGYKSCEQCRIYWRDYQRARRAALPPLMPLPIREQARALLTATEIAPRDVSSALDISAVYASLILRRLWEQGYATRRLYRDRSYRYRLRDA